MKCGEGLRKQLMLLWQQETQHCFPKPQWKSSTQPDFQDQRGVTQSTLPTERCNKPATWANVAAQGLSRTSKPTTNTSLAQPLRGMEVNRFAIENPKRKVPPAYVASLSQTTPDLIEKMSSLPTLQSSEERLAHLQRLNEGVKEDTSHSQAIIQGIRDRPDPSRGSTAGLELRQFERRVRGAISDCTSSFKPQPHTSITIITEASSSDLSSNVSNLRIRVRVIDRDVVQSLREATALETRSRINETIATYPDIQNAQVQAYTQLPSGDVELRLGTMDEVGKLTRHEEIWGKLFGAGAHVLRDTFSVILHGIRTSTIKPHQTNWATISRLLLVENAPLFPNADIVYTGWLCSAKAKRKSKTSIVVSFSTPEDGNRAIEQGMIWEEALTPQSFIRQGAKCNSVTNANIMDT